MTNALRGFFTPGLAVFVPILLLAAGCGPGRQEMMARDLLAQATNAYDIAYSNPCVVVNAGAVLQDAADAIKAAEQASDFEEMEHLAYMAERKTRIAVATTRRVLADNDKKALRSMAGQVLIQGLNNERDTEIVEAR
jgi:hypothetical protein